MQLKTKRCFGKHTKFMGYFAAIGALLLVNLMATPAHAEPDFSTPTWQNSGILLQDAEGHLLMAGDTKILDRENLIEKIAEGVFAGDYDKDATFESAAISLFGFTSEGNFATNFGNHGGVITPLPPRKNRDDVSVTTVLQDRSGRLIVVGWRTISTLLDSSVQVITVACYSPEGRLDTTFGKNGFITQRMEGNHVTRPGAALLDEQDRLLIAGYYGDKKVKTKFGKLKDYSIHVMLSRYTATGMLDSSFGNKGIVSQLIYQSPLGDTKGKALLFNYDPLMPIGLMMDSERRLVLAAGRHDTIISLMRFSPEGKLDNLFGEAGIIQTDLAERKSVEELSTINALLHAPQRQLLAIGTRGKNLVMARYSSEGVLDTSYGHEGIAVTPLGKIMQISAVTRDGKGNILVAAFGEENAEDYSKKYHFVALARFDKEGLIDTHFGNDGVKITDLDEKPETPVGLIVDKENVPVMATFTSKGIRVVRYLADDSITQDLLPFPTKSIPDSNKR